MKTGSCVLGSRCLLLSSIELPGKTTDAWVLAFGLQLAQLETVKLSLGIVTDAGLVSMLQGCLELRSLSLSGKKTTDTTLSDIEHWCSHLYSIGLLLMNGSRIVEHHQ
jgi:hypothetical protein